MRDGHTPPLNALRAFESAARLHSFSKAAAELRVTQSAISRQIDTLERFLGFELFARVHARIELTPNGQTYASAIGRAFGIIDKATDEVVERSQNAGLAGTVITIHGYSIVLDHWLTPLLSRFQLDHPEIVIRFLPKSGNDIDFIADKVDISIQLRGRPDPSFSSDFLFADESTPMCSPSLLKGGKPLRTPLDLGQFDLLHARQRTGDWQDWFAASGYAMPPRAKNTTIWEYGVLYDCLLQGRGIALAHLALTEHLREKGDLIVPFDIALRKPSAWYLVCLPSEARKPNIALLRNWLLMQVHDRPPGVDVALRPIRSVAVSGPVSSRSRASHG